MNWTEGNLARHSRGKAKNEILNRQKTHFAKARSNLLNSGPKNSPIAKSFLTVELSRKSQESQKQQSPKTLHLSPLGHFWRKESQKCRSPGSKAHQGARSYQRSIRVAKSLSRSEYATNERKRPLPDSDSTADINEKRRRLLSKADWAGLGVNQPAEMTFLENLQAANGSRWSKINPSPLDVDHASRRFTGTHRGKTAPDSRDAKPKLVPRRLKKSPVYIEIGSQEIRHSASPSSQMTRKRFSLVPRLNRSSVSSQMSQYRPDLTRPNREYHSRSEFSCRDVILSHIKDGGTRPSKHHGPQSRHREVSIHELSSPVRVVYSSSDLYEPVPLRKDDFAILQWSPAKSDGTNSVQVEVGRAQPKPTATQLAENQNWMALVASSDCGRNGISPLNRGSALCRSSLRPVISPGISATESQFELPAVDDADMSWELDTPQPSTGSFEETNGYLKGMNVSFEEPNPIQHSQSLSDDQEVRLIAGNVDQSTAPAPVPQLVLVTSLEQPNSIERLDSSSGIRGDTHAAASIDVTAQAPTGLQQPVGTPALAGRTENDQSIAWMKLSKTSDRSQEIEHPLNTDKDVVTKARLDSRPLSKIGSARAEKDDNNIWMNFVFDGHSDELEDFAFGEAARRETLEVRTQENSTDASIDFAPGASMTYPSDYSTIKTNGSSCDISSLAASTQFIVDAHKEELRSPATAATSHVATHGSMSPPPQDSRFIKTSQVTVPKNFPKPFELEADISSDATLISGNSNCASMAVSLDHETVNTTKATVASSDTTQEPQAGFRFAMPRTFVGKLAKAEKRTTAPEPQREKPWARSGRKRGRPRKKALDGRFDIRGLPNFDDDPIEEFDED